MRRSLDAEVEVVEPGDDTEPEEVEDDGFEKSSRCIFEKQISKSRTIDCRSGVMTISMTVVSVWREGYAAVRTVGYSLSIRYDVSIRRVMQFISSRLTYWDWVMGPGPVW